MEEEKEKQQEEIRNQRAKKKVLTAEYLENQHIIKKINE